MQIIFSAMVLLSTGIFLALSLLHRDFMHHWYANGSYYFMFIMFVIWLAVLVEYMKEREFKLIVFLKEYRWPVIFCLLTVVFVSISVPAYFRVISDETNLFGVARSMTYEKAVYNAIVGHRSFLIFNPIVLEDEKRPFLFPFLTSVTHTLLGFSGHNAFRLNAALFFFFLLMNFLLMKESFGKAAGYAVVLAVVAQPILVSIATSGGYDLLSLLFVVINFAILKLFLKNSSPVSLKFLWISLSMLAHTRHESSIFFFIVIISLFAFGYIKIGDLKNSVVYSLTPAFFLPIIAQRLIIDHAFENPSHLAAFSYNAFIEHSVTFFKAAFLNFDFVIPFAPLINIVGGLSIVYFIYLEMRNSWLTEKWQKHALAISFACILALWITVNSFWASSPTLATNSRHFSMFFFLLCVLSVMFLARMPYLKKNPALLVITFVGAVILYHPVSVSDKFINSQVGPRECRVVSDFLNRQPDKNFLLITERAGNYTAQNFGAFDFGFVRSQEGQVLGDIKRRLFGEVFVVQNVDFKTGRPIREHELSPNFKLHTVYGFQNDENVFTRISKMDIDAS